LKFLIEFGEQRLTIEAVDAVQAITSLIDAGISIQDNAEFNISSVSDSDSVPFHPALVLP
jgi:hypothetical protein